MSALPTPQRTTPADQRLLDEAFRTLAVRERLLPVKVSRFYRAKVDEEIAALGHTEGPLHRTVHPPRERFTLTAGHEVADWVDDRSNMPVPGTAAIIHKYPDRVLFMPTAACASHCQYCFRQDVLAEEHDTRSLRLREDVARLVGYLATKPDVSEVILSGGDPMTLPIGDLVHVLTTLRALPQVRSIRIHTRTLVFAPQVFRDPERIAALAEADVRLVFHVVHPYEVCGTVAETLGRLSAAGLRLYNHFPLLRGVNDHAAVLRDLIERLDDLRVRTLSVYVPEPIRYSAPYRVPLKRIFALQDELTETAPGWMNAIRFTLDSPLGKIRREHIVRWDEARGEVIFAKDGREIRYPDFPADLDEAGDPAVMLWRTRP